MAFLRSLGVVLIIGAVIAALVGYRHATENRFTAEQVLEDSFPTTSPPRLVVETFNGPVEIVTNPEPRVEVRVTKKASGSSQELAEERLDEIEVTMTQVGDTVRIEATQPEQFWNVGNRSISVFVQVPADSVLDLRTRNGGVTVTGPTAEVTAQTSNGRVSVTGCKGEVKLTSSNGGLRVEGGRGTVELKTSNGTIEIKTKDAVVNARTSNGSIRCEGPLAQGDHILHTSNGGITVSLPGSSQFVVDGRTSNGRINSAFNVKASGKQPRRRLQGQVGENPTMTLRLETSNGGIDIKRDEAIIK